MSDVIRRARRDRYSDPRWQKLRLQIMDRDQWACCKCGDKGSTLNVHHKIYIGRQPWDTPPRHLQTLCDGCHFDLGDHPRAGVWWEGELFRCEHCPRCGHGDFPLTYADCESCGALIAPRGVDTVAISEYRTEIGLEDRLVDDDLEVE